MKSRNKKLKPEAGAKSRSQKQEQKVEARSRSKKLKPEAGAKS